MKEMQIMIPVRVCAYDELDAADRALVDAARRATDGSYAPYSHFHVGAAILLADGTVVTGANQENAAFSSGTCAERSALFYAAASHPGVAMRKIAIAARTADGAFQALPISPCGACRQALLEYEHLYGDMEVILYGADKIYRLPSVGSLLPLSFTEF